MQNKILGIFFLIASNSFAQDCTGLKENDEVRLDKNGGPLVNSRIQDQDGLGTCFANATSVALQSALPGNPDVSYLQLAFSNGQQTVAPKNQGRDSAFQYSDNGEKGEVLIQGGHVCDTIAAVKSDKIGGVCSRDDVALEKSIFDPTTNSSKDSLQIQNKIIKAVSEYYDSAKLSFGINSDTSKKEIAKRTMAFNDFKGAFENAIANNQQRFSQEACLKPDITNAQTVYKNSIAKTYNYFVNKYGEKNLSKAYERVAGKTNPDAELYFYYLSAGSVNTWRNAGEVVIEVDKRVKDSFTKNYMSDLSSANPPADAMTAYRNSLIKITDKKNIRHIDKMIADLSPADKELIEKDYNRYVKKDVGDCIQKNALAYYKSDEGLVKDFANDVCLRNYLSQGKNLQNLAQILDQYNLNNIDALNSFINKLPTMSYEEAMRSIVAPDCSNDKKIKIPKSLTCEANNYNYTHMLRYKLIDEGKISRSQMDARIKTEEERIKAELEAEFPAELAAIEAKFAGKTDEYSLKMKDYQLKNAEIEKENRKKRAGGVAAAKVPKDIAGAEESRYWNAYVQNNKKVFNTDAINLLKNQKQAIPITLCTRMFTQPDSQALRDGRCEKDGADNTYQSVGGYHAMTVVGVRCQKGKLNYLIQNSWGDWESIKSAKNADGSQHFEHEFGKAWMNEDEVMDNSYGYQKISK